MNYYILKESTNEKYLVETNIENISMIKGFKTTLTKSLGNNFPTIDISITYFRLLPDYFTSGAFLLVSERLKDLFVKSNAEFEYYPINIKNKAKQTINSKYYYAHLLSENNFMDKSNSIYEISEYNSEYISEIEKLVINKNTNITVSYLEKCLDRSFMLINEDVAKELLENKITGIKLELTESV